MSQPELDPQLKARIEQWARERAARDQASIKFGLGAFVVMAIGTVVWLIVWWINPDQVSKILVEMRARGVDLPESKRTYPVDGAPILDEQWGWDNAPELPFRNAYALDAIVVDKSGASVLIESKEGDHRHLIIAADTATEWSAIQRALAAVPHADGRLFWLAVRTPERVGEAKEEVTIESYERSDLGVVPVPLRHAAAAPAAAPSYLQSRPIDAGATFESVVKTAEGLYAAGRSVVMLPIAAKASAEAPPDREEK